jgi:hypothetical protein
VTAVLRSGLGPDFLLLTLCRAADLIDAEADAMCAALEHLLPGHPVCVAAFGVIDRIMTSWHMIRLVVAQLRARSRAGEGARAALLGAAAEADELRFSASMLPTAVLAQCQMAAGEPRRAAGVGR